MENFNYPNFSFPISDKLSKKLDIKKTQKVLSK